MINKQKHYSDVEAVDIIHQVSNIYVSTKVPQDYGTGEEYTSVEVHMVKQIADHPGITPSELAYRYGKTRGAISQVLKKIEKKGLIVRKSDPENESKVLLFLSEAGAELDKHHREYDCVHFGRSMNVVRDHFTESEIDTAFCVLEDWLSVRRTIRTQSEKKLRVKKD